MSLTTTSKRVKRGLRNHPAPLNVSLLGIPGASNPRRRTTLVSAARPSIKESVAALGLNYSLSSGGIPELSDVPGVPPLTGSPPSRSSPNFVLDTSSDTSSYTTTDTSTTSLVTPPLTTPPNLARLYTLCIPPSPVYREQADATIHAPPPSSPSDLKSPVTPLLTPAPARPVRRWGIAVFPENNVIRRVSSAPSSPISFDNPPVSPTSIIAIKSPEEWRDSKRISDMFSLMTPFTISFPQETDDPLAPPIRTQVPPAPIPSVPSSLSPIQKSEDLVLDIGIGISRSVSKVSRTTLGKNSSLVTIEESDSPAKSEEEQPRSPQTKTGPKSPPQGTNSHRKRTPFVYRRESSVRRPDRHLMLKRDSGAPFSHHVAMVTNSSPLPSQPGGTEVKGGWKNTRRLSASGRFLRASTMKTKATTVTMRKGKKVEEKDVVAVIPQLRELKAPKRFRW